MRNASMIGCRVESEGHYGTVLYQGEVPPTKGEWLGIDWDDPSRGKHDGSHKGVSYFKASHPSSGSFLRPQKANFGVKFTQALNDRYGRVDDVDAGVIKEDMFVLGKNNQQTVVEVVGAQSVNLKQSKFEDLKEVSLRDTLVNNAGDIGEVASNIPNVVDLDIGLCLFSSWDMIARITQQLPKLNILNVSGNRLSLPEDPESLCEAFSTVKVLYMNRMNYDWNQIASCLSMFKNLKSLHVCFNRVTGIDTLVPNLDSLTLFNIESNPIETWESIQILGQLPKLETLISNNTGLEYIRFDDAPLGSKTKVFPCLTTLSISYNKINEWGVFNEINKLPKLTHLNFKFNPLSESLNLESVRSLVIARISGLQYLNRTKITGEDRKGAEIDYLKNNGKEWKEAGGHQDPQKNKPSTEFTARHPNYQALIDKYGPPEDSELKEQSSALKNSLLAVIIDCPQKPEQRVIKKKLPATMTVQKLKTMLQRLCKVDAFSMKLTYTSLKHKGGPEIDLENDMKEIGYYSIEEGDTIHIKF